MNKTLFIFFLTFFGVFGQENDSSLKIKRNLFKINGITIFSNESEVIKKFGKPKKIDKTYEEAIPDSAEYLKYQNITFYLVGSKVFNIISTSKTYKTENGITVGSKLEELKKKYGNNNVIYSGEDKFVKYAVEDLEAAFFFYLDNNNTIIKIELFFEYT